jgi:hypothetical protein
MPPSMMALRERFNHHPLLPTAVVEQQNRWRERWGMQPKSPEPGEDWRYYFDPTALHDGRPDANDPRNRLRFELVSDTGRQRAPKYFLTGSKGAGKSTTAYSLWDDPKITARYTLVGFTIHDYLNLVDTDASQIIAVMIAHLHEMLRDAKEEAKLGDLDARATIKGLDKLMRSLRPNIEVEKVNVNWFGLFTASFKESAPARAEFTKYIKGQMEEVQAIFDDLNGLLEVSTGKKTLFVVDDLDKIISDDVRKNLFHEQLPVLLRPRCAALYSYPIEVDRDPRFSELMRGQANRYVLANVKLVPAPDEPTLDEGRQVMTEFVRRRIDDGRAFEDVFTLSGSEWDRVLHYSAGNFRELSRLLSHALEVAAFEERAQVDRHCFEKALRRVRADYNMFVQQYRGFLNLVRDRAGQQSTGLDPDTLGTLLAAFVVVEYPNEPGWLGLNPVVADLLDGKPSTL